jgi:hypothetical protein
MVRLLLSLSLVLVTCTATFTQSRIGFTNLDGFPGVVVHQQYNLSGWIKNTGTASISGDIDVIASFNGGNNHQIDNNFNLATPLAPGDSVLWTKNNYTFPYGQMVPGQNDVLIWPTKSSGNGLSDTLKKPVFFADGAAFALLSEGLEEVIVHGVDIDKTYGLSVMAFNIGESANRNAVGFYMQVGTSAPVLLRQREQSADPEQRLACEIEIPALRSRLEADQGGNLPEGFMVTVRLYAEELDGLPYYQAQQLRTLPVALLGEQPVGDTDGGPLLYPVPSNSGVLQLTHTDAFFAKVRVAQLLGTDGRLLAEYYTLGNTLDLSKLVAGHYLLRIESTTGETWLRKIVLQ